MKVAIRENANGKYLDKYVLKSGRFNEETLTKPPYNFLIKEIPGEVFDSVLAEDFDEKLNFSIDLYNARQEQALLEELRNKRQFYCFYIINRGQLWYDSLTEEQLKELKTWYHDWLDVTKTKQIPKSPSWLPEEEEEFV